MVQDVVTDATPATTPTVSELLDAAYESYTQAGDAGDLTPFLVNGKQVTALNETDGLVADAWLTPNNQVVIAYEGTLGVAPSGYSLALETGQLHADSGASMSTTPVAAETDALAFEKQVASDAASEGISAGAIFVTGHSLGATLASYVGENTGDGGIAFEPMGIAPAVGTVGDGGNFVTVDTYGDPVPAYSSSETALGALAPANQPLYGQVLHIGDPSWQGTLSAQALALSALALLGQTGKAEALTPLLLLDLQYHSIVTQAYSLGVTLPPAAGPEASSLEKGNTTGPVLSVAGDTITQLLAYIASTDGNTEAAAATTTAAVATASGQRFIDAMASLAPHPAAASDAGIGAQAWNTLRGALASGGPIRQSAHLMLA